MHISSTRAARAAFFFALSLLVGGRIATAQSLPSPWSAADIGAPQLAGSSSYDSGTVRIAAAGEDIWNNTDQFHFVYQSITGDAEIVARIDSFTATHGWAKAGVMIRGSIAADAPHAYALASWENGIAYQRRITSGAESLSSAGSSASAPHWVRLVRRGTVITSYESNDGANWQMIGSDAIPLGDTAYVGLAVTSHEPGERAAATFSGVRVSPIAGSTEFESADIGGPLIAGSTNIAGGTYTIRAGGTDIWDTSDQFRFVYRPITGDADIIARLASLSAVDVWTKAGVIVRESLTANSRHAIALATGDRGYGFQRRVDTGSWSEHTEAGGGVVPVWLRLVRSGSRFDAYYSSDGTNWTRMGTDTIPMSETVYVGLAVTSHNETVATQAVFDNLRITGAASATEGTPVPGPEPTPTPPPRAVMFEASADHDTLVTRYVLEIYASNATPGLTAPLATSDLGKPSVASNGEITVDQSAFFLALAPGNYIATITALGDGGSSRSLTATFTR
jgi:regulation of enolase protein 1 (concanavalin A-like superfamily)